MDKPLFHPILRVGQQRPGDVGQVGGTDRRWAGEQAGARGTSGAQSGHRAQMAVPVPSCPVAAACPAFLAVTFSRGMWQLLTGLPQGCFDQSFPPASPLFPSSGTAAAHCHLQ